jgi:uncharacterized glyoxalase superfamily protein PhnB
MKALHEQPPESTNRSMPSSAVIPELAYPDVRAAVDWLCHTFGFVERLRIGNHRAQLTFGSGSVIVTGRPVDPSTKSSEVSLPVGGLSHSVTVRVADVDQHYTHAKQAGAHIVRPPSDYPYGERQYSVDDLGGHRWTFSETIADIDPKDWGGTLFE